MASMIYGPIEPHYNTVEYPAAADQVWAHAGANFCFLDGNGRIIPALTGTTKIFGWAIIPKGTGAGTAVADWKASSTEGKDKLAIVLGSDGYTFVAPADDTATLGQSGNGCDILNSSATDSTASLVDIGTSTNNIFIIQGLATDRVAAAAGTDVLVKFNTANLQVD